MSKKERHSEDLSRLLDEFLKSGDDETLVEYLTSNSSLPGRRANIELARAFAEVSEEYSRALYEISFGPLLLIRGL